MAKKSRHVTITDWKGHKNYECKHCKFATLNQREFRLHLDVHIRNGLAEDAKPVEEEDEDYGLDVGAPTNEEPKNEDPKKSKGKKVGK